MADNDKFSQKVKDNPLIVLDLTNDLEQIPIGPSEEERNMSRLNKVITGEKRPASHTAKEAVAWSASNVGLPLLAAWLKGANVAAKGSKGLAEINKFTKPGKTIQQAAKSAEKAAEKNVKNTAKKVAEKKAGRATVYKKSGLVGLLVDALDSHNAELDHMAAKSNKNNVKTAISALNSSPANLPKDMVNTYAMEKGAKTLAGTLGAEKAGNIIAKGLPDGGLQVDPDTRKQDPRIEMSRFRRAWEFIKGMFDLEEYNPDKYPMDLINKLLVQTNADADMWDKDELDGLGDDEKVKLIKDIMKGKYNDYEDVSKILLKNYVDLTNTDEE